MAELYLKLPGVKLVGGVVAWDGCQKTSFSFVPFRLRLRGEVGFKDIFRGSFNVGGTPTVYIEAANKAGIPEPTYLPQAPPDDYYNAHSFPSQTYFASSLDISDICPSS